MRKLALISIPILVLTIIGVILFGIRIEQPSAWQDELAYYLQYKNVSISGIYDLQTAVKASTPWNFSSEMSQVSIGESMYYQTDIRYSEEPSDHNLVSDIPREPSGSGLMPLPYPPEEVWCVLLKRTDDTESNDSIDDTTAFVLVALHQDLYNADYVVHETAAEVKDQTYIEIVKVLGCDLP